MHFDKNKYLTPQKHHQHQAYPRPPQKYNFPNRPQSPKYQDSPRSPKRDTYINQNPKQSYFSTKFIPSKQSQYASAETKLQSLIFEALCSADKMAKELLEYDQPESEYVCSNYFLSREKLNAYLTNHKYQLLERQNSKNSKKSEWRKDNARESGSSDATQQVPIDHLERLERIVYNQIIPIMETGLNYQRKKVEKGKKTKEWAYTDYKEGLLLLQRLNQKKKKTDLDDYAEVLEKFIRRVMDKEQVLMNKLIKLQAKLEDQMRKTGLLYSQKSLRQAQPEKKEATLEKAHKDIQLFENFVREVKSIFKDSSKDSSPKSLRVELNLLLTQIKNSVWNDSKNKNQKLCPHKQQKTQKQLYSNCKEQNSRSEQQAKTLKEVISKLDREVQSLREQCQTLQQQLANSSQKLSKLQLKSSKLIHQNQQLNEKIQKLTSENYYKNNMLGEYVNMANRLQEHMKDKQEKYIELQEQNERLLQNMGKKDEDYQKLLRHVQEVQQRNKELEQMQDQAHRDLEELIQKNYVRQFEVAHITNSYERHQREMEDLRQAIREKDQIIALLDVNKEYILDRLETQSKRERRHSFNQPEFQENIQGRKMSQENLNFFERLSQSHDVNQTHHTHHLHQELPHFISQAFPMQNSNQIFTLPMGNTPYQYYSNIPLQPNPLNQNQGIHLQLPDVMNQLASNPQSAQTSNNPLETTIFTPHFNDNVQNSGSHQDEHYHLKRALGQRYANLFNEINIRNSLRNNSEQAEDVTNENKKEKEETDVSILQKTIELLQKGAKQAQEQIERLKHQNKLLMANNQFLFQKLYRHQSRQNSNNLSSISLDGYSLTQQQFNNVQRQFRPDFIPGHINKQIIQEVIRDLDQQKKSIDQRSHNLKQQIDLLKRQSDMLDQIEQRNEIYNNAQRKQIPEAQKLQPGQKNIKKRREDWDPGYRFMDQEFDQNQKKRRDDWDPGHRFNGQSQQRVQNNSYQGNGYIIKVDPQNKGCKREESDNIEPKEDIEKNKQSSQKKPSQSQSVVIITNIIEEFIQQKEPAVQELITEETKQQERKKSNIIPIDSQQGSNTAQGDLIKIEQRRPQSRSNADELIDSEAIEGNPQQKEEIKGQKYLRVLPQMDQTEKIKQLLEAARSIREAMILVLTKQGQVDYHLEIKGFLTSIEDLQNMLTICKKTTTRKLNKLQRIQIVKRQAEEEIRLLKKKLQTANQLFSNITSNDEVYDLSFSQQLQQILRKSPKFTDDNFESPIKSVNDVGIQTDRFAGILESSVRRYMPAEFKRFMSSESLVNSLLNKSFIDELEGLNIQNLPNQEKMKKIQSGFLDHQQLHNTEQGQLPQKNSSESNQSNHFSEDLKRSRIRIQSEVRQIGNMIGYHRDQILYLHNILTKTMSMPALRQSDRSSQTPRRPPPLTNTKYADEISRAPQKNDKSAIEKLFTQQNGSKEIQRMLQNRESQLERLLFQRQNQISRLKDIVKKLTQLPSNQGNMSPHQSRSKQTPIHEIQQLRAKLDELEVALQRQATENQRLRLQIKEQQVQHQLLKMKFRQTYQLQINSFRELSHQQQQQSKNKEELVKEESNKQNGGKILSDVLEEKKASQKEKGQPIRPSEGQEDNHNIQSNRPKVIDTNSKSETKKNAEEVQPRKTTPEESKLYQSPTPQQLRPQQTKAENSIRQNQPRPEDKNSQKNIKDSLKDLLPEFFGEKGKKN